MTRESKQDLELLRKFVTAYNLTAVSHNAEFDKSLAQQHRRYLALLIFIAEISEQRTTLFTESRDLSHLPSELQIAYLDECASDVGQALFCWMNGAYKGSRVLLRSAIENFVKGTSCSEQPSVLTERSLYKVFEIAALVTFFSSAPGAQLFSELNIKYGELSLDVHTASTANMAKISALNYFPTFAPKVAKNCAEQIVHVTTRMIVALCVNYNVAFHTMHHRNKETVLDSVPSAFKQRIQNVE